MTVPDRVVNAAAEAYYTRAAAAADAARQRAQNAFAMTSVIAGAVAGAGIVGGIDSEPLVVQILGYLAFVSWLLCAGLLLHAAVGEYRMSNDGADANVERDDEGNEYAAGGEAFVHVMYQDVVGERDWVYNRLGRALWIASLALALTALTAGGALLAARSTHTASARVTLSQALPVASTWGVLTSQHSVLRDRGVRYAGPEWTPYHTRSPR